MGARKALVKLNDVSGATVIPQHIRISMDGETTPLQLPQIELAELRRALDLSFIGTALITLSGEWLYANRRLKTLCRRWDEAFAGKKLLEITHEDDREQITRALEAVLHGDVPSFENQVRLWRGDGAWFWALLSGSLLRTDGGLPHGFLLHVRDITPLKQAEQDLQLREKRLRMALSAGRFGEWEFDLATGETLRGAGHDRIFGYEQPLAAWSLKTLLEHVVPADRARVIEAFAWTQQKPGPTSQLFRVRRAGDGQIRWIRSYAHPEIEDGVVARLFGVVVDVTEQQDADERLRQSEERHRLAASAVSEAVWDWDLVADRVTWTEALTSGFGHAPVGLVTDSAWWLSRVHPEDVHAVEASTCDNFAGEGGDWSAEYRFQRGDGSWAHVLDRARIVRDVSGRAVRVVGAMLDLSERKRAEAELRATEAQLRTILDTVPVGIVMAELPSGAIVNGNSHVERLLGHPMPGSRDAHDQWVGFHADGSRVSAHEFPLARMEQGGEDAPEIEVHYQRGDGLRAWTRLMGRSVRDESGALVGGVVAIVDIDAERRAKAGLEALNRELETRVSQQVTARLMAEDRLRQSQKLEAIGQLTGGVAHDFNNLLTVMIGSLEDITEQLPSEHALQGPARLARSAAERGAELTSQLLSFARRQPQQPVSISTAELLGAVEALVSRTLRENITLSIEGRDDDIHVLADRAQLEAAMLNLCLNARDAMPDGGGLVISARVTRLEPHDVATAEAADATPYCCLSVTDHGAGMDADTLARAVEPFFTTKPPGQGTGLGLSMVYGFARQSGGEMRIRSEPGRGATVSLYLPLTAERATRVDPPVRPTARAARILVAEDNDLLRSQVVRQLEVLGHTVTAVANGVEALEILRGAAQFDLLFTDMVMPGGVGGDALAEAAQSLRRDLRVLITTGYAGYFNEDDGVARRVLTKPYRRAQLAAAIEDVLAG